ncbi:MAG: hypothetical protein LBG14_00260 [Treponema sp.]|nr:hypothetical protein [Treponema sp.]
MAHYPRPPYKDPSVAAKTIQPMFSPTPLTVPEPDYPVTPLENFRLAVERKTPYWMPNSTLDFDAFMSGFLTGPVLPPEAPADAGPWGATTRSVFTDDWGAQWLFVPEAGGPMLDPNGKPVLEDITQWEKTVKFPNLKAMDWKSRAEDFMKNRYNPRKVLHINIGQGCTERFVALLGGYTEAMVAMADEPEACRAFFDAFAEWEIEQFDIIHSLYPVNLVTYHDDWGTERDTFFSEKMMEAMVLEPTRKIVQHIKDKGVYFELHSCGAITRFLPYMIDMHIDLLQIQRRANDMPKMKEEKGDKIGFCCFIEGIEMGQPVSRDQTLAAIRKTVDLYGKKGGSYTFASGGGSDEDSWAAVFELYCYSREFYDKERGAA